MSEQPELMTREAFMETLDTLWGRYLSTLEALPEADQRRFAQAHGYNSLKHLLAHLTAWMLEARAVINAHSRGGAYAPDWATEAEFNASTVQRIQTQTLDQVKEDFENARTSLAGAIAEMPVEAVREPMIYRWLYASIVTHYRQHQPPGDPQVPAEQHVMTE